MSGFVFRPPNRRSRKQVQARPGANRGARSRGQLQAGDAKECHEEALENGIHVRRSYLGLLIRTWSGTTGPAVIKTQVMGLPVLALEYSALIRGTGSPASPTHQCPRRSLPPVFWKYGRPLPPRVGSTRRESVMTTGRVGKSGRVAHRPARRKLLMEPPRVLAADLRAEDFRPRSLGTPAHTLVASIRIDLPWSER